MEAKVAIVILTFNCLDRTKECIEMLERHLDVPSEIVLFDNASVDGTREYLCALKLRNEHVVNTVVVLNGRNEGFILGSDAGARIARAPLILLLNNDCLVGPGAVSSLVRALEETGAAAAGPLTNRFGAARWPQLIELERDGFVGSAHAIRTQRAGQRSPTDVLLGHCMLLRSDCVRELGLFDKRFGIGNYEDIDLCLRLSEQGYGCVIAHDAVVYHHGHSSFRENRINIRLLLDENRALFERKWGDRGMRLLEKYLR